MTALHAATASVQSGRAAATRYSTAATAPPWVLACTDRCPACCGLPVVAPSLWAVRGDVLVVTYRCPSCGHGWPARWDVSTLDGAA